MISIFFLLSLSLLHGALGTLVCEQLPVAMCSYAIASSGNRCLLETSLVNDGSSKGRRLYCKTSNATANHVMNEYIETDSCINACGVDRMAVGISSDNLLDSRFSRNLCSSRCLSKCPNIADLYHNLALGEGMNLPDLCSRVMYGSSRRAFLSNLAVEAKSWISSSAESDELNLAAEPEPPLSQSEDEDEIASAPEASPLFEHDRVNPNESEAAAAAAPEAAVLPDAPDVIADRHPSSGFIRFKVAATPV